jgi:hypothetical protein
VPGELRYDGRLLAADSLPAGVREALAGASAGDFRMYVDDAGRHHFLLVRERIAPRPRALEDVRDDVAQRVFSVERNAELAEWTRQMRERSEIRVFVDAESLGRLASGKAGSARGE